MHFTVSKRCVPKLIRNLQELGYTVVGPSLSGGVVRLAELKGQADFAAGAVDVQAPGRYALGKEAPLVFSSVNGPDSPKRYLRPAEVVLTRLVDGGDGVQPVSGFRRNGKYAFFGIRPEHFVQAESGRLPRRQRSAQGDSVPQLCGQRPRPD